MTEYVEFHARSAFSFLEGASLPEFLMQRAAELEMPAMALLDRNGVYGAPRFHMEGQKHGVRAHIGAEVAVSDLGERLRPASYLPHQWPEEPVRLPLLPSARERPVRSVSTRRQRGPRLLGKPRAMRRGRTLELPSTSRRPFRWPPPLVASRREYQRWFLALGPPPSRHSIR